MKNQSKIRYRTFLLRSRTLAELELGPTPRRTAPRPATGPATTAAGELETPEKVRRCGAFFKEEKEFLTSTGDAIAKVSKLGGLKEFETNGRTQPRLIAEEISRRMMVVGA